jgi:hypothetical protein
VLLLLVVLLALPSALKTTLREPVFQAFGVLILWMIGASALAPEPLDALVNGGTLVVYLFAAATAFHYLCDDNRIFQLLTALALAGCLGAMATIVDHMGLVDLPGVNEATSATHTELGYIMQASGPFARRSAMAAYYTLIISTCILLPLLCRSLKTGAKVFFFFTAGLCALALMLTHNRAGVLGAAMAAGAVAIASARSPIRLIRTLSIIAVIALVLIAAVNLWFPDLWMAYQTLLGIGGVASADDLSESDQSRLVFAQLALLSVLNNPIGHGYSLLAGVPGYEGYLVDPHNILSQVIWGSGLFGLFWLLFFGSRAAARSLRLLRGRSSKEPSGQLLLVLLGALLAFLLTGMTHTIISTGVAWILFGTLLRLVRRQEAVTAPQAHFL